MYDQDREAWIATDLLRSRHSDEELKADQLKGWIVDSLPDRDLVRFIQNTPNGPKLYYDVSFVNGSNPTLSRPEKTELNAEELAKYRARTLALNSVEPPCTDSYNTVVLKDPERDGWLVWVLAATHDPSLVVYGKHYRFSISRDGGTVQQKDALSKSCLAFHKPNRKDPSEGEFLTHLVSPTPVETHVFGQMSYGIPLYVGTVDGQTWKLDGGTITTIDFDSPGMDGVASRHFAADTEVCKTLVTRSGGKTAFDGPEVHVLAETEGSGSFKLNSLTSSTSTAVLCIRNEIVPAPNDYKVVLAGSPLYIGDKGLDHLNDLASWKSKMVDFVFGSFKAIRCPMSCNRRSESD